MASGYNLVRVLAQASGNGQQPGGAGAYARVFIDVDFGALTPTLVASLPGVGLSCIGYLSDNGSPLIPVSGIPGSLNGTSNILPTRGDLPFERSSAGAVHGGWGTALCAGSIRASIAGNTLRLEAIARGGMSTLGAYMRGDHTADMTVIVYLPQSATVQVSGALTSAANFTRAHRS
ncbi:MAG: hypothetical protein IPK26_08310 [Planctomycetes bacterium]|nr:hypothetical protein [Planctomycetota bacterium]